jgi:NAD(P)H-nitrite reductase large subunit
MNRRTLVVVGTGMAGGKLVEEVVARAADRFTIRMFGAEPGGTYNRILLSRVLAGLHDCASPGEAATNSAAPAPPDPLWLNPLAWYEQHGIKVHAGIPAERIDPVRKLVHGGGGKVTEPYDVLVLATGSRPFVPPVGGTDLAGVFVFRTLEDCAAISERALSASRAVILGGGLLGLEAAYGLLRRGLEVTVVEAASHLMVQQLDATAGQLLRRQVEALGARVLVQTSARRLTGGDGQVAHVELGDGTLLDADLVVISCGIRPNVELARAAGLTVERAIVVDDQLRTSDAAIYALGECVQHRGQLFGLVDPVYEQARVLADVLTGRAATYTGSQPATTLKVMGIDLTVLGESRDGEGQAISRLDSGRGVYQKLVLRDRRIAGAILLGAPDRGGQLRRLFQSAAEVNGNAWDLLHDSPAADAGQPAAVPPLPDDAQVCNCNRVHKQAIVAAIRAGHNTVEALGQCTKAGTGCGSCQPLLAELIRTYGAAESQEAATPPRAPANKIEKIKQEKDGLDSLDDILRLARDNRWQEMTEADKQRFKWHGLFFRVPTPGHFMLRLRFQAGQANARQFRVIADLADEFGKGFCDLTTRQQIQLRWFTLADAPEIWRRLAEVGLHSKQTGMDNVRGVCGCPVAGLSPHELLDASPVVRDYTALILDNRQFTNLPRKFNVTITGCMENCCHTETQDLALVPAFRELEGVQVNGFNVLVGGKQGSGGYRPATPLNVFVRPEEAAQLCGQITALFRDHGSRASRTRARLAFLIEDRGIGWFRAELERRWGRPLLAAGTDARKKHHADHLGIHPQRLRAVDDSERLHYVGFLVPVGRITSRQLRQVADLAERYGNGDIRLTVGQNLVVPNIPEARIGALADEPLFTELPYDPSPVLRGLVSCTGNDYCHMALIDTKGYAVEVARELERRTAGKNIKPLTIHWSGCPAGCGLHQVATIGLQGCRSRVNGQVVDAAHVCVNGRAGPQPVIASDLLYDVPCDQLADALEPLVRYLPRTSP